MRNLLLGIGLGCLGGLMQAQPPTPRKLSLDEAIQLGLKNNLSALQAATNNSFARVERIRALSALLPTVSGSAGEYVQEINLATFGFRLPGVPTVHWSVRLFGHPRSGIHEPVGLVGAQESAGRRTEAEGRGTERAGRA